jgi:TonB family protein
MTRIAILVPLLAFAAYATIAQQPAPPPSNEEPVAKMGVNGVKAPVAIRIPEAEFPPEARRSQMNGRCAISMIVDVKGRPKNVALIRCSDNEFATNALKAAEHYQFKPATNAEGGPVPVRINLDVRFRIFGEGISAKNPQIKVASSFRTPPDVTSSGPDASGVYPLTTAVTAPRLTVFKDAGYGDAAFGVLGTSPCDVLLTIDAKGVPSDAQATQCERPGVIKPLVQSLLKSQYSPGSLNGQPVPVRASIHIEFDGFAPTK